MASTTYHHFVDTNKMYAAQEQFRDITKMVCARLRGLTKTCHLGNVNKLVTFCHRFANIGSMVRNAGQMPQTARHISTGIALLISKTRTSV